MAVGKLEPFVMTSNWDSYVERLEQYFIANNIEAERKISTLITVVGAEAYELMVNLCTPEKPSQKSFKELVALMKSHLQPKPCILVERYKFRKRFQNPQESIADYVADLKKLSKECGFTAETLKENLRDQFVCGLRNENLRQRLFAEDNVTFDLAMKLAIMMDAAEVDAALMRESISISDRMTTTLNKMSGQRDTRKKIINKNFSIFGNGIRNESHVYPGTSRGVRSDQEDNERLGKKDTAQCNVCGRQHTGIVCKYRLYVCRVCNKKGHLRKMCPNMLNVNNVELNEKIGAEVEGSSGDEVIDHFSFDSFDFQKFRPFLVDVTINNVQLCMEIDTGSAISCISWMCYKKLFSNCKLLPGNLTLRYYTGEMVKPVGKISVYVTYKEKSKLLDLFIFPSGKTSLLGRQWLCELEVALPIMFCNNLSNVFDFESFRSKYCEVFDEGLGRFTGGKVGFHLRPEARPVFLRARPLAYALRAPVERTLDELVRDGILTPVNSSDWATPIVPVMKKDGTIRICGDYKLTLNKYLETDRFPLPRVEDLLAKLYGGEKFSKLDLSQAYCQLELDDESKKYTVINTHKGLFMYNRLIFGLASSPGIFQRILEGLFCDMPRVGVFLDDLIITGENDKSHLDTLHEVFSRLSKHGLKIKKEKCSFFANSVTYLGFVISKEGVHTCPKKIEAIQRAPIPTNTSEVRSFLGLIMYYAKFIPNISNILSPLYNLLKKNSTFVWSTECELCFRKIKDIITRGPVLAHYSPSLPLILTTDASSVGVGAVISHLTPEGERPIAYASRVLNAAEKSYSQIEREALSIVFGIKKFHQYLYGRKFTLRTDHKPLVTIFGDKSGIPVMAASRMQRWAVLLSGYTYDIEYVRSEKNAADALSRLPVDKEKVVTKESTYINFIQDYLPISREVVMEHTKKDASLRKILQYIETGWPNDCNEVEVKPYFIRRNEMYNDLGCVVWGYRLVIPNSLRSILLKELHNDHMGIVKMKAIARSYMWWPGIDADIENICRSCETCAEVSPAPARSVPQSWPYVSTPWTRLHLDFLGPFHGKTFLVIIDSSTKWLEIFQMTRTTAEAVIKVLRETFARFGLPREVVSDNGPPFSSSEYAKFMKNNGIKVTFTAVYHPASNGAAEGAVKLCKRAIRKAMRDRCDIDAALQSYLLAYRNVEHCTTGVAPAVLLQKRNLRSRLDLLKGDRLTEDRVYEAQKRQMRSTGGKPRVFNENDRVWIRNYGEGKKWEKGTINKELGSRHYIVRDEKGVPFKRHVDQIKNRWIHTYKPLPDQSPDVHSPVILDVPLPAPASSNLPGPTLRPRPTSKVKRYGIEFD